MEPAKPDELSQEERAGLIAAAFQAKEKAYCRYSNFHVGAALLANNGTIIQGANIENASYGATICAERTALVKAVSEGINRFRGLAVVTDIPGPCSPCGVCRQFLREFCQKTMPVLLVPADYDANHPDGVDGKGAVVTISFDYLLPMSFGPEDLERPRQLFPQD